MLLLLLAVDTPFPVTVLYEVGKLFDSWSTMEPNGGL